MGAFISQEDRLFAAEIKKLRAENADLKTRISELSTPVSASIPSTVVVTTNPPTVTPPVSLAGFAALSSAFTTVSTPAPATTVPDSLFNTPVSVSVPPSTPVATLPSPSLVAVPSSLSNLLSAATIIDSFRPDPSGRSPPDRTL